MSNIVVPGHNGARFISIQIGKQQKNKYPFTNTAEINEVYSERCSVLSRCGLESININSEEVCSGIGYKWKFHLKVCGNRYILIYQ
jgi:hypothetical protein